MANLRKHVAILGCLIFLDLHTCALGEFTADAIHGLSLSIFEIKSDMASMKRRIENLEKKVQDTSISTTVTPQLDGRALTEEDIIDIKEDLNMQALAIQKTLAAEKLRLRETVDTFVSKFADLESKIEKNIASINASIEGKSEVMFDRINSSSSALASGIAKLTSDFTNTTTDIRQSLKTVETTIMSDVRDIETRMMASVTTIQKEGATKSTISSLQSHLDSLDSTVSSISYNQTHFIEQELRSLSSRISSISTSLSSRISSIESSSRYIAFHAFDPRNWSPRDGEIIVFQYVYLNEGVGYDASNGIFRAPVNGLYLFSAHFCNAIDYAFAFGIYVGEKRIAGSTIVDNRQADCASVTVVTMVDMWQSVTVRGNYGSNKMYADYHRQPSFIGVRIRA